MGTKAAASAELAMNEAINDLAGQRAMSLDECRTQPVIFDDARWDELVALTGGSANLCYQCGACTAVCPWGLVREDTFSVRSLIRGAQLGFDNGPESLWLCTACSQCEALCPRGVNIGDVIRGVRHLAWQDRQTPPGLPSVMWSLLVNNNPWEQPPSARSSWASDLRIPYFDQEQHELLLYVGCTAAYDRRIQSVARALVNVLRASGVTFGFLADDEPCCGEPALSLGQQPFFDDLMISAANLLEQRGVSRVVTISPHCFHAFVNHMPSADGIKFFHYPQYLAYLVSQGRLVFDTMPSGRVTFHDPCYLARHHGDATSARRVLSALPGIEVVEMDHHGPDTICCGGGGGRMWLETAPDERFADLRLAEAVDVQADHLITACPFCLSCLEDSVKAQRRQDMRVLDLAELVSWAVIRGKRE